MVEVDEVVMMQLAARCATCRLARAKLNLKQLGICRSRVVVLRKRKLRQQTPVPNALRQQKGIFVLVVVFSTSTVPLPFSNGFRGLNIRQSFEAASLPEHDL
jgi:hypothetical protein